MFGAGPARSAYQFPRRGNNELRANSDFNSSIERKSGMSEMIRQGSEHTDQEILNNLKQDLATINTRIDMLWNVLDDQHEINMMQFTINKTLEHNILILVPKQQDEVMH